jgi:hypothetical protein
VDFLKHSKLLVDPANSRLLSTEKPPPPALAMGSSQPRKGHLASTPSLHLASSHSLHQASSPSAHLASSPDVSATATSKNTPFASSAAATLHDTVGGNTGLVILFGAEFPSVFGAAGTSAMIKHDVKHHLVTAGPPIASKFRWLDSEKLAKEEFAKMEAECIVRRPTSPWSSPLLMVLKPDGSWRPCGHF